MDILYVEFMGLVIGGVLIFDLGCQAIFHALSWKR